MMERLRTNKDNFSTPKKNRNMVIERSPSTAAGDSTAKKPNFIDDFESISLMTDLTDDQLGNNRVSIDRFIPLRSTSKLSMVYSKLQDEVELNENGTSICTPDLNSKLTIRMNLKSALLGIVDHQHCIHPIYVNRNMLSYSQVNLAKQTDIVQGLFEKSVLQYRNESHDADRKVRGLPVKVLDAPALQDDFYLNLLDWSHSDVLSVGLGTSVYLWKATNGKVLKICDLGTDDMVTSVQWANDPNFLSVGNTLGQVFIWDINKFKKVRTFEGHSGRVGALSWSNNVLASGSRDKSILLRDVRSQDNFFQRLSNHKQEVCGIKWSPDNQMFCSGGNDNKLFIWTPKANIPIFKSSAHKAAVKALAWSPHQYGLLATGGGSADRCIRFWNTNKMKMIKCIDTGSQVCNLAFSKRTNDIISTHGYSQNQIHVWNYPKMRKVATLTGHSYRVLYLSVSPDGTTIVTGAGDETLRLWEIYPKPAGQSNDSFLHDSSLAPLTLR